MVIVEPTCGLSGASNAVSVCQGEKKAKVTGTAVIILILYENKVCCLNGFIG